MTNLNKQIYSLKIYEKNSLREKKKQLEITNCQTSFQQDEN